MEILKYRGLLNTGRQYVSSNVLFPCLFNLKSEPVFSLHVLTKHIWSVLVVAFHSLSHLSIYLFLSVYSFNLSESALSLHVLTSVKMSNDSVSIFLLPSVSHSTYSYLQIVFMFLLLV